MTTRIIKRDDDSFLVQSERPTRWAVDSAVTVDIIDTNGTTIVDSGSVTVYAGDTLASAANAGAGSVVLS